MHVPSAVRSSLALSVALLCGWWLRGVHTPAVFAQYAEADTSNRSTGDGALAFQLSGIGPDTALTVWNASNRTLYIYQGAVMGNSNVNCSYSFHIQRPGGPIQRQNCPIGQLFPSR